MNFLGAGWQLWRSCCLSQYVYPTRCQSDSVNSSRISGVRKLVSGERRFKGLKPCLQRILQRRRRPARDDYADQSCQKPVFREHCLERLKIFLNQRCVGGERSLQTAKFGALLRLPAGQQGSLCVRLQIARRIPLPHAVSLRTEADRAADREADRQAVRRRGSLARCGKRLSERALFIPSINTARAISSSEADSADSVVKQCTRDRTHFFVRR